MSYTIKVKNADEAAKLMNMVQLRSKSINSIATRKFKDARSYERQFASLAVDNFHLATKLPIVQVNNAPWLASILIMVRQAEYNVFKLFTKMTPDEKQYSIMAKDYLVGLAPAETEERTLVVNI